MLIYDPQQKLLSLGLSGGSFDRRGQDRRCRERLKVNSASQRGLAFPYLFRSLTLKVANVTGGNICWRWCTKRTHPFPLSLSSWLWTTELAVDQQCVCLPSVADPKRCLQGSSALVVDAFLQPGERDPSLSKSRGLLSCHQCVTTNDLFFQFLMQVWCKQIFTFYSSCILLVAMASFSPQRWLQLWLKFPPTGPIQVHFVRDTGLTSSLPTSKELSNSCNRLVVVNTFKMFSSLERTCLLQMLDCLKLCSN